MALLTVSYKGIHRQGDSLTKSDRLHFQLRHGHIQISLQIFWHRKFRPVVADDTALTIWTKECTRYYYKWYQRGRLQNWDLQSKARVVPPPQTQKHSARSALQGCMEPWRGKILRSGNNATKRSAAQYIRRWCWEKEVPICKDLQYQALCVDYKNPWTLFYCPESQLKFTPSDSPGHLPHISGTVYMA